MADIESYIWYTIGVFLVAILGFLAKVFIQHRLAKSRNKQERFNEAAAKFCEAFTEVRRLLDESRTFDVAIKPDGKRVYDILMSDIDRQERVMMEFKRYLSKREKIRFAKAWDKYYSIDDWGYPLSDYRSELHPVTSREDPEYERKLMKLALDRIEALLKFAEFR